MSRFSGFLMHKRDCTPSMRHKKICVSNFAENEAQIRKKGECAQGGLPYRRTTVAMRRAVRRNLSFSPVWLQGIGGMQANPTPSLPHRGGRFNGAL